MQKRKIPVSALRLGLYVTELDRPWLDSPFPFQGFFLESHQQLAALTELCSYVYVDDDRSVEEYQPDTRSQFPRTYTTPSQEVLQRQYSPLNGGRQLFREKVRQAQEERERVLVYVERMLRDVRLGHGVNATEVRELVKQLVVHTAEAPYAALWLTNLKSRHEYTMIHCVNVCILSIAFGCYLNLPVEELETIGFGALLHDIGKMRTPVAILDKPDRLTEDEFDIIKKHPLDGYSIVRKQQEIPPEALEIIRFHHERISGQGYPDGLKGDEITQRVRMVAIADVYDAITSDKIYRDGVHPQEGLNMMYHWAPNEFGSDLMQDFIKCIGIYPIGSLVELNTGALGLVMSTNRRNRLKPVVMLIRDRNGQPYLRRPLVNLAAPAPQGAQHRWSIKRVADMQDHALDLSAIVAMEAGT